MSERASGEPATHLQGPLDVASFPETLSARVITPGPRPCIHGYDVEGDLARHYGPADLLLLSLTGELPDPAASAALNVALVFLAPVSVAHASVHAAVLARTCGTTSASTIGVAAIALAEQARVLLDDHMPLLDWLQAPSDVFPDRYRATTLEDRAGTTRLRQALAPTDFAIPELGETPTPRAALLAVLFRCGLRERAQIEATFVTARLASTVAEAMCVKVADFNQYPTNLPRYLYAEQP